jgi:hypothetical protein
MLVERDAGGLDRQHSAVRHRISRVRREVHHDLLGLLAVGVHRRQRRLQPHHQLDVLTDEPLERGPDVVDESVQAEQRRFDDLFPAEGEQLARQAGGPATRLLNLQDVGAVRLAQGRGFEQQLAVAENRRQEVVEVVRHAPGKPSDRFHCPDLVVLLVQRAAVGYVHRRAGAVNRFAVRAEHDSPGAGHPVHGAIGPDRSILDREGLAGRQRLPAYVENHAAIGGVKTLDERILRSLEGARRQTVVRLSGRGQHQPAGPVFHLPDSDTGILQGEAEALFVGGLTGVGTPCFVRGRNRKRHSARDFIQNPRGRPSSSRRRARAGDRQRRRRAVCMFRDS